MKMEYVECMKTGYNPAHVQVACDGTFIGLPLTRTTVGVWNIQDPSAKPLKLEGHRKILTSLVLGNVSKPKRLCSAAEDYLIVWNIHQALEKAGKDEQIKGVIIGTTLGYIQHCAFSPDDSLVAACNNNDVLILRSNTSEVIAALEGHMNRVTCAEFCPHYSSTLVTISEDRTFKVWNIADLSLVYQSTIITASPFISMTMNLHLPQVAIGTADGIVRVFDLSDGKDFRCVHQINIGKIMDKYRLSKEQALLSPRSAKDGPVTISSKPSYQRRGDGGEPREEVAIQDVAETGCAVLGLYFSWVPDDDRGSSARSVGFLQRANTMIRDLFSASPMLVVGTTGALLQINAKTMEVIQYFDLQDRIPPTSDGRKEVCINNAGSAYFSQGEEPEKIFCVIGSHFQNHVHLLKWDHATSRSKPYNFSSSIEDLSIISSELPANQKLDNKSPILTVLSSDPMLPNSILKQGLVPKQKEEASSKKQKGHLSPGKQGQGVKDQPLTFQSKIKSSGYTEAPRTTMFKPKTSFTKQTSTIKRKPSTGLLENALEKEYPANPGPPKDFVCGWEVAERPTPVNAIAYSGDGLSLACGLANKSAQVFKIPYKEKKSYSLAHNHIVNDVRWSCDSNWLVTACDDKTVRLWQRGQTEAVLTLATKLHNLADGDGQKKDKENAPFPKEIKNAQFYYMDRFLILTSSNTLHVYKYHLDPTKQDIKRYVNKSRYKQVQSFTVDAQYITAMSAVNDFYSYIVMCAGSSKTLEVYDMNVGKCVRVISDVHTRPVHCIKQHEGSKFVSHPRDAYDLFLTSAAGDCIKLWDLRANRCVRRYEGHLNRSFPCGVDLSPCGKYVVTGAEDRCVYVYDIRGGTYCSKLTGFTDTVSAVAFHPLHSQLMTASLDGKLRLFTD
ncbi:WD repeat-containing protein 27-like isoform X2 [Saccostrea echinata]|uniref:WD repeat-containing protein 27-like isoform X1 n=1 Tax=Saccostrea echinata TaxID=191078 RepID=UPI002A7FF457|nr:WD repeat-containing protein 27-like isoform X1 [Saccostrea echinata]XP_061172645.1 WD repeat-containing protein 27-like isoform X2 [Saccostrea echinata]